MIAPSRKSKCIRLTDKRGRINDFFKHIGNNVSPIAKAPAFRDWEKTDKSPVFQ